MRKIFLSSKKKIFGGEKLSDPCQHPETCPDDNASDWIKLDPVSILSSDEIHRDTIDIMAAQRRFDSCYRSDWITRN